MSKADEYRKKASEARAMAEGLTDAFSKALWLEVAENWLRMIPKPEQTAEQQQPVQQQQQVQPGEKEE